jgi:hypothetical protein
MEAIRVSAIGTFFKKTAISFQFLGLVEILTQAKGVYQQHWSTPFSPKRIEFTDY